MDDNDKTLKIGIFAVSVLIILFGISYAFLNIRLQGEKKQVISSGELSLELAEDNNNLTISNALPMYDEVGMIQEPFTFRLVNNGDIPINYIVGLVDVTTGEKLDTDIVKYGLTKDGVNTIDLLFHLENGQIDSGMIEGGQTINYELRLWIDSDVEDETLIKEKSLSYKIGVEARQMDGTSKIIALNAAGGKTNISSKIVTIGDRYGELPIPTKGKSIFLGWYTEAINGQKIEATSIVSSQDSDVIYAHWKDPYRDNSGASYPELASKLIPVKVSSNGEVQKADIFEEWYDYDKKVWANAVVLEENAQTYKEGDVINPADIGSYFVWIPRYRYKIFNEENYPGATELNADAPQTIEIEFESKNASLSTGASKGEWLSHPAFQAFDTNGFWVGKFESSYKGATDSTSSEINSSDFTKLQIKPNVYSWRNITVGNAFKVSYDYLREAESHMMKNTEWGAVAYLSHSKYGVNTEVYLNNNSAKLTGCGADTTVAGTTPNCLNVYGSKTNNLYNQSTTGNISGIFDISGGADEYVMGYNTEADTVGGMSEITNLYPGFFNHSEWDKYYDKYTSSSNTAYNNRILGDATGEMGPFYLAGVYRSSWYSDLAYFVSPPNPWFHRGGNDTYANAAGIFDFSYHTGANHSAVTFRVVLTPKGGE